MADRHYVYTSDYVRVHHMGADHDALGTSCPLPLSSLLAGTD
jgi:hypothetical protein